MALYWFSGCCSLQFAKVYKIIWLSFIRLATYDLKYLGLLLGHSLNCSKLWRSTWIKRLRRFLESCFKRQVILVNSSRKQLTSPWGSWHRVWLLHEQWQPSWPMEWRMYITFSSAISILAGLWAWAVSASIYKKENCCRREFHTSEFGEMCQLPSEVADDSS